MNTPPRKQTESGLYAPVWREFNKLIDYVREISITGSRNVRVNRSMNGTTVVGLPESRRETGLNFRGEYDPAESYAENDVVIYGSYLALSVLSDGTKAGTYIANEAISPGDPAPGEPASNKWRTFARFATPTFAVAQNTTVGTQTINQKILLTADGPAIRFSETGNLGTISIDLDQANGKQIALREIGVCVDGVNKKMIVLGSEVY